MYAKGYVTRTQVMISIGGEQDWDILPTYNYSLEEFDDLLKLCTRIS